MLPWRCGDCNSLAQRPAARNFASIFANFPIVLSRNRSSKHISDTANLKYDITESKRGMTDRYSHTTKATYGGVFDGVGGIAGGGDSSFVSKQFGVGGSVKPCGLS